MSESQSREAQIQNKNRDSERKAVKLRCPKCHDVLDAQGNISHSDHRMGTTTEGKVSCSNCEWTGLAVVMLLDVREA